MLFNKNENKANERIIYKTKSNMIFGCKKAIFALVLLIAILSISPVVVKFVGKMQVYLISQIQLPLTRYAAIAFFVIILIIVIYIIWQIMGWYSLEYILTDSKIMVKSGVISTKKNYMPYATIQDVNTSQNILARLLNIGTVSVFSAYDNNQLELKNISNPSEIEDIIFSYMQGSRSFQPHQHRSFSYRQEDNYLDDGDYFNRDEIYDEFEPITPINRERDMQRRDYEYYPEDRSFSQTRHKYEYEPYEDKFENEVSRVIEELEPKIDYYSNEVQEYYFYEDDFQNQYNNEESEFSNIDLDESSEKVIRRHFDKFNK